jgi:hypothetical protein
LHPEHCVWLAQPWHESRRTYLISLCPCWHLYHRLHFPPLLSAIKLLQVVKLNKSKFQCSKSSHRYKPAWQKNFQAPVYDFF